MSQISTQWMLALVGAIMLGLALKDIIAHRQLTSAGKTRLVIAILFAAVLAWNHAHQG